MTIRQLYYTSCQHGKEGIRGFQVNAASPGLAEPHEDLGLRLSAYRPPPSAPVQPTPEQIARFPIAVGYQISDDVAVLFHSRYLGTDFTGRQGNYFAHVLVLDQPEHDLARMLPIEAWESALWTWQPSQATQLPTVDAIPRGPLADREHLRAHLLAGRLPAFGTLLTAVQQGLSGRTQRVVVVAPDARDIARAVAAVSYSLPTSLALAMSFITFTSSPMDANVLVAGTTPDVEVSSSPYGDQIVVRLAADDPADGTASRYVTVLQGCWARGVTAVAEVTALAARVSPPLQATELDQFADLVELAATDSGHVQALLLAVEFALRRLPAVLTPALWQRVDEQIRRGGAFADIQRWSAVFAGASSSGVAPGTELESAYVQAALARIAEGTLTPAAIWLPARMSQRHRETAIGWGHRTLKASPRLATTASVLGAVDQLGVRLAGTDLEALAVEVVLSELLNPDLPDVPALLKRVPNADQLLALVRMQLEERLANNVLFDAVVEELSPAAAELLTSVAPGGSRCGLAAALARARATGTGRMAALLLATTPLPARPEIVERFVTLIWPQPPTADEGVQLCRRLGPSVLSAMPKVLELLLARLIEDAEGAGLTTGDEELAEQLAGKPIAASLGQGRHTVECIRWGTSFKDRSVNNHVKPTDDATQAAKDAVGSTRGAGVAVATRTLEAVADWLLALPHPIYHAEVLDTLVREGGSPNFVTAYDRRLAAFLATAKPAAIAAVLPAVVFVTNQNQVCKWLLDTCKNALVRRRKRDLDTIGRAFADNNFRLERLLPKRNRAAKDWPSWWKAWRERHLSQSVFARLLSRHGSGGDD